MPTDDRFSEGIQLLWCCAWRYRFRHSFQGLVGDDACLTHAGDFVGRLQNQGGLALLLHFCLGHQSITR